MTSCNWLITGGTGSLGQAITGRLLKSGYIDKIIILSRDELKQHEMKENFRDERLRFFLGDIRDRDRLSMAFDGVDVIVHAAALKQVPAAEYNPFECVQTNVLGAKNVASAAAQCGVSKVIGVSTDKAVHPITLYGATKLVMERLFIHSNVYSKRTRFSCVRYGNVFGSRGSVARLFLAQHKFGQPLTITSPSATRFWLKMPQAVDFVLDCVETMQGGEVFIPKGLKCSTVKVLANTISDRQCIIGARSMEKEHEILLSPDEPVVDLGNKLAVRSDGTPGVEYSSRTADPIDPAVLAEWVKELNDSLY